MKPHEGTCDELKQGSSKVLFNPVVHAMNADTTGVVSGTVTDAADASVADVEVTAFPAGTVVDGRTVPTTSTFSAPSGLLNAPEGSYALRLDPGSYDIYVRAQGATDRTLAASSVTVTTNSIATEDLKISWTQPSCRASLAQLPDRYMRAAATEIHTETGAKRNEKTNRDKEQLNETILRCACQRKETDPRSENRQGGKNVDRSGCRFQRGGVLLLQMSVRLSLVDCGTIELRTRSVRKSGGLPVGSPRPRAESDRIVPRPPYDGH